MIPLPPLVPCAPDWLWAGIAGTAMTLHSGSMFAVKACVPPNGLGKPVAIDRVLLLLVIGESALWLSSRCDFTLWHKGYAALAGLGILLVAILLLGIGFVAAVLLKRRFQYTIRSLLLLTIAVALPLSWLSLEISSAKRQRAAVDEIAKLNGLVIYDSAFDNNDVPMPLARRPAPVWLLRMMGEDFFSDVESVFARGSMVTDANLECLRFLNEVKEIDLLGSKVTDVTIRNLSRLKGLYTLRLSECEVSNLIMEHVGEMTQLHELALDQTQVADADLSRLKGLSRLEGLYLRRTRVTAVGVKGLQEALPNCEIYW